MKLPGGFLASGVDAGVRKKRSADLALFVAPDGADAAAVFTRNRFQAAPVVLSRQGLKKSGGRLRGVVVNAGCANAATGAAGLAAARSVRSAAAKLLACSPDEIFVASTGVIGVVLPDEKIRAALPEAVCRLSSSAVPSSRAILTTDSGPKVAEASFAVDGRRGRIVGIAKGAGMIHPDMATMLVFVMTDLSATPSFLRTALLAAADASFHAISVDGDTSTNDTVLLMASGALGNSRLDGARNAGTFVAALTEVCRRLAWKIVRDGEGATRVMEIHVTGARNSRQAKLAAHAVATSPLVKTALHGGDPNWGRILAAVGRSGARFSERNVSLSVGPLTLVSKGTIARYREKDAARLFSKERVPVTVDLGAGSASAEKLSCDLGHPYVSLNADYRS